jgi:RNA polymerase sigma-70 factor (sigma-E family)
MTFEEYVLARGAALVRFARLLTGDDHRAEDLTQDVLAKAYVSWWRVGSAEQPDLYVRRMLLNAHHSWWRRRSNREVVAADLSDRRATQDASIELAERAAVWRLVRALPARQRTVIVLRYYEDYDDATIAELMGCTTGTVRTQAKRALEKLQASLPALLAATQGER